MVDGFRFGFYGINNTNPWVGIGFLSIVIVALSVINLHLLKKGTGLRS
jgi:ABC-2 type transport system permease protein